MGWLAWDRMTGLQSGGTASVPQACSLGFGHGAPAGAGAVAESREVRLLPGAVLQAWMAGTRRSTETEGWKEVCDPVLEMEPQINIYLLNR